MINIAVLLTCFNRREKTKQCLESISEALEYYNTKHDERLAITIFLTDDGSTDGTSESARAVIPNHNTLHILRGNGNLFWAGGMRLAWKAALDDSTQWDYYLLVNDDTVMLNNLFEELFATDNFVRSKYGHPGVYTGCIRDPNTHKVSFGGSTREKGVLTPVGNPQMCEKACANVMFFHNSIVEKIGTFDERYKHGAADYDYSITALRSGIPVCTTGAFVGVCENEHRTEKVKLSLMPFTQRKKYLNRPTSCCRDNLLLVKKFWPWKYPFSIMAFYFEMIWPRLYEKIVER